MFSPALATSMGNSNKEGRGCGLIAYLTLPCLVFAGMTLFRSFVPNAALVWNASGYHPAKFVVRSVKFEQGGRGTDSSWIAIGTINGNDERIDVGQFLPHCPSSSEMSRDFPQGKVVNVLLNEHFKTNDMVDWSKRVILGGPDWLDQRRRDMWTGLRDALIPLLLLFPLNFLSMKIFNRYGRE